jgi:hypothetical protein
MLNLLALLHGICRYLYALLLSELIKKTLNIQKHLKIVARFSVRHQGETEKKGVVKLGCTCAVAGKRNETRAEKPGTADVPDKYTAKINLPSGSSGWRAVYGN